MGNTALYDEPLERMAKSKICCIPDDVLLRAEVESGAFATRCSEKSGVSVLSESPLKPEFEKRKFFKIIFLQNFLNFAQRGFQNSSEKFFETPINSSIGLENNL